MTEPICEFCGASDKHRCRTEEQAKLCQAKPPANWTQQMIYRWARDQFGDAVTPLSIAIRMNKEMSELLSALQYGQFEGAKEECADLLVMLSQIHFILSSGCRNGTLVDDMNAKMEINKHRVWKISEDGSHQHIEEDDPLHPNYICPICDGGPGNDNTCLCPKEY